MSLEDCKAKDVDSTCCFVGTFVRKALEQGWSAEELKQVSQTLTVKQACKRLKPHIEYVSPDQFSSLTPLTRTKDYLNGCLIFADDPNAKPNPFRWYLRNIRKLVKRGQRNGWLSHH